MIHIHGEPTAGAATAAASHAVGNIPQDVQPSPHRMGFLAQTFLKIVNNKVSDLFLCRLFVIFTHEENVLKCLFETGKKNCQRTFRSCEKLQTWSDKRQIIEKWCDFQKEIDGFCHLDTNFEGFCLVEEEKQEEDDSPAFSFSSMMSQHTVVVVDFDDDDEDETSDSLSHLNFNSYRIGTQRGLRRKMMQNLWHIFLN